MRTPSPRSQCPLPSAGGSSFPSQALMSPASARAQRPLMVPTAAGRGQGSCLQGREMGQQWDRHMVGTGPCPMSSPVLGNPQLNHRHRGDADLLGHGSGRFWGSVWPPFTAGSPRLLCTQPKHTGQAPASWHSQVRSDPSNQIYS